MKNKSKKFSFILALVILLAPIAALGEFDDGGFQKGFIEAELESELAGLTTQKTFTMVMGDAISWIMTILATASTLMFVVAGIMYVTAGGEEDNVTKAKKIIQYAVTGMVIALVGFLIVEVIAMIAGDCTSFICVLLDILFPF